MLEPINNEYLNTKENNKYNIAQPKEHMVFSAQSGLSEDEFEKNVRDENLTRFFTRIMNYGNKSWQKDYLQKNNQTIELNPTEQKCLELIYNQLFLYKNSLSEKESKDFDKLKQNAIYFSKDVPKDFSKMTKEQLLDILHFSDITDNIQDGKIGSFRQGTYGSCWFLSCLKNASYDRENSQIIKDSIKNNGDGTYTIKFKGTEEFIKNNVYDLISLEKIYDENLEELLTNKFKDCSEEEKNKLKSLWTELCFTGKIDAKTDNEKYLVSAFYELDNKIIPEKIEKFIKEKSEELKNGITITEEEFKNSKSILPNGEIRLYSTGDKDVTLLEMAANKFIKIASNNTKDINGNTNSLGNLLLFGKKSKNYSYSIYDNFTEEQNIEFYKKIANSNNKEKSINLFEDQINSLRLTQKQKQEWTKILENTRASRLMTCTIKPSSEEIQKENKATDQISISLKSERLGERRIYKEHSYNISKVDKENKIIYVEDPHESTVEIPLEYEEFFENFRELTVIDE